MRFDAVEREEREAALDHPAAMALEPLGEPTAAYQTA